MKEEDRLVKAAVPIAMMLAGFGCLYFGEYVLGIILTYLGAFFAGWYVGEVRACREP